MFLLPTIPILALQDARELRPDDDGAINLRANLLLDTGRHTEALEAYRQGLELNPEGFFSMHSNLLLALNYGRVLTVGTPREVQSHPDVVAAYLGG